MSVSATARTRTAVEIAYEARGSGPAAAAGAGPRLRALGLGARRRAARRRLPRDLVRQPRHRRERRAAGPLHRRRAGRRRRRGPRRRRDLERAHVVGASLGGMVAQELALADPGARRPARARLHDAGRRRRLPDAGADRAPDGGGGIARAGRGAPALRRERARSRAARARRGDLPAAAREPAGSGRLAGPGGAGATFDALDRIGGIAAPTLVVHGTEDNVVDPRNAELLAARIPGARARALRRAAATCFFWEQPDRFVALCGSSCDERPAHDRHAGSATARARRRARRDRLTSGEVTYAELDEALGAARRRRSLERGLARGDRVATLTGELPGARRRPSSPARRPG